VPLGRPPRRPLGISGIHPENDWLPVTVGYRVGCGCGASVTVGEAGSVAGGAAARSAACKAAAASV
jgi:hypothetical protein